MCVECVACVTICVVLRVLHMLCACVCVLVCWPYCVQSTCDVCDLFVACSLRVFCGNVFFA